VCAPQVTPATTVGRLRGRGVARSPAFAGKAIDLCAAGDPICTKGIQDLQWHSHLQPSYIDSGLVDQAASFVAGKL
jgi:cutinase